MSQTTVRESVSAVLITQGDHRFYTLTLDSDTLAKTCVAVPRAEDPDGGFQRRLDPRRAESIAGYIDAGGVIPGSIVLSGQDSANVNYDGKKKTIQFDVVPGAFLIIDGQHRVFGFKISKKKLRVPVVIFSGLNKRDEARLFIDINTLQKPVPNELLLDIKKLAETENDVEQQSNSMFDSYNSNSEAFLFGLLSPFEKAQERLTRNIFLAALKPIIKQFSQTESERLAQIFDAYLYGFASSVPREIDLRRCITKTVVFRAVAAAFPDVATLVGLRFQKDYSARNFETVLKPIQTLRRSLFTSPGTSYKELSKAFTEALDQANREL